MTWHDLVRLELTDSGIQITFGFVFVFLLVLAYVALHFFLRKRWTRIQLVEAEIALGGIGKIKIKPSYEDVQVAHRAWVELATRKAALLFDEENDVIVEIFDSWYELFGRMRELVKEIPAHQLRSSRDTRELVRVLVDALNNGLRPLLTQWQAKFRRWYEAELDNQKGVAPQAIQRQYPEYKALVKDLKVVNPQIVEYARFLKRLSQGQS